MEVQFLGGTLGPGILGGSFLLSARTERKEKRTNGRGSGGEKPFPNIRGIKKSLPQLSSSSNRLSKNISSASEKTVHQPVDDDQLCEVFTKGNRVNESRQKSSGMVAGPSWTKAQRLKNSSGKRQSEPQEPHVSSQPTSGLTGAPQAAGGEREGRVAPEGAAERSPPGPGRQGASGRALLLAFQSLRVMKEDADEDSASDLSDSERVPMSPSPLSPPDLRLRAEEIDPGHLDAPPGRGRARPEASYPDFLPAPFSSWDLRDMALLLHAEQRPAAVPRVGGPLGRFVDRLVQLEWLQMRTVQGERAKAAGAAKAKAPAAAARSPGRGPPAAGAGSRAPQGAAAKPGPARKRGRAPGPLHLPSSQGQTADPRAEDEKERAARRGGRQPRGAPGDAGAGPRIESGGNIRALRPSAVLLDAAEPRKAPRAQAHATLKKKGGAGNCGLAPLSGDKRLRTNGGRQSTHKFK